MYVYRKSKLADIKATKKKPVYDYGVEKITPKRCTSGFVSTHISLPIRQFRYAPPLWSPDYAFSQHDMVPIYGCKPPNAESTQCSKVNSWNLHDPAIRQLSAGITHQCHNRPASVDVLVDPDAAQQHVETLTGYSCLPRLHAASSTQRRTLDSFYQRFQQSLSSGLAFDRHPILEESDEMLQPSPYPLFGMTAASDFGGLAIQRPLSTVNPQTTELKLQLAASHRQSSSPVSEVEVKQIKRKSKQMNNDEFSAFVTKVLLQHLHFKRAEDTRPSAAAISHLAEYIVRLAISLEWDLSDKTELASRIVEMAEDKSSVLRELADVSGFQFTIMPSLQPFEMTESEEQAALRDKATADSTVGKSLTDDKENEEFFDPNFSNGPDEVSVATESTADSSLEKVIGIDDLTGNSEIYGLPLAVHRQLIAGKLDNLPAIQSRVIRLFVSSNFADMKNERNALLRDALPQLQEFAHINDLQMQLVDLCWGIGEDFALDPVVYPICIEQISYSRQFSSGPFFAALLGDYYGNQILPQRIPEYQYRVITEVAEKFKIKFWNLLEDWYELDENNIPSIYILKPVRSQFANYCMMEYSDIAEQLRRTASRQWFSMEQQLREILEKVVSLALDEQLFKPDIIEQYSMSLTEIEIRAGMMTGLAAEMPYCLYYTRHIQGLEWHLNEELAPKFIDITGRNNIRRIDHSKQDRLARLRESLERLKMTLRQRCDHLYEAQLWEIPDEPEPETDDALVTAALRQMEMEESLLAQDGLLFEDPLYLQKYVMNWDETLELKAGNIEAGAFLTAENEKYLTRLTQDFVHDCQDLIVAYFFDKLRVPRFANRLEEVLIHHIRILNECNASNPLMAATQKATVAASNQSRSFSVSTVIGQISLSAIGAHTETAEIDALTRMNMDYVVQTIEKSPRIKVLKESFLKCARNRRPLVIHGPPGSGRTAMTAIIRNLCNYWLSSPQAVVVARVLATSRASNTIEYTLSTVCHQMTEAFGLPPPREIFTYATLFDYFGSTLNHVAKYVTEEQQLVLILDGLDHLLPAVNLSVLNWLPRSWPKNINVVFTTDSMHDPTMKSLWRYIESITHKGDTSECFMEIPALSELERSEMVTYLLAQDHRRLTSAQLTLVMDAISANPWPLYAAVLVNDVITWPSSHDVSDIDLSPTIEAFINKLLTDLENQLGAVFVSHTLAYITADKGGLSEVELEDVLSCDDEVLEETFLFIDPPLNSVIRVPQMYLARLLYHLSWYLIQIYDYGIPVFFWSHFTIMETVRKRYLVSTTLEGLSIPSLLFYRTNRNLANLFYATDNITQTVHLRSRHIVIQNVSRHVMSRPLDSNQPRKLRKLPVFLYNAGPESSVREECKSKIFCNTEWMVTKLLGRPFQEALDDVDQFVEKDQDLRIVDKILRASNQLHDQPYIFQLQLLARFSPTTNAHSPMINRMVAEAVAMSATTSQILLIPLFPCIHPMAAGADRMRPGPSHIVSVAQCNQGTVSISVWGQQSGLSVLRNEMNEPTKLVTVCTIDSQVTLDNMLANLAGTVLYHSSRLRYLSKSVICECRREWDIDLVSSVTGAKSTERNVTPLAVNEDDGVVVVLIPYKLDKNSSILRALAVVDIVTADIIGNIGEPLQNNCRVMVEFIGKKCLVTLTDIDNNTSAPRLDGGNSKLVLTEKSTVMVYNSVPSSNCNATFTLPAARNHKIPCIGVADSIFIGCDKHTEEFGSVIEAHMFDKNYNLSAATPLRLSNANSFNDELVYFLLSKNRLLVVLINTPRSAVLKIKDIDSKKWRYVVRAQSGLFASCMTFSVDQEYVYIGYKMSGIIERYTITNPTLQSSRLAHSGDVITMRELWPAVICSSGSDNIINVFDMSSTSDVPIKYPLQVSNNAAQYSNDELTYYAISKDVLDLRRINQLYDSKAFPLIFSSRICTTPMLLTLLNSFTVRPLAMPAGNFAYFTQAMTALNDTVIVGLGIRSDLPQTTRAVGQLVMWDITGRKQIAISKNLYADMFCLSSNQNYVGLFRKHAKGYAMLIYDIENDRTKRRFTSKRVADVQHVIVTADTDIMITVDSECVALWMMAETSYSSDSDYLDDTFRCDDAARDNNFYYYDDDSPKSDQSQSAEEESFDKQYNQEKLHHVRYLLKVSTKPTSVHLLSERFLIVGSSKGHILFFDLSVLESDHIHRAIRKSTHRPIPFVNKLRSIQHKGPITTICISASARYVVSGSTDHTLKVYDRIHHECQAKLIGHNDSVLCACITLNDMHIVSGSADCTIRLWQLSTGIMLSVFDACVDIYNITVYLQDDHDSQLRIAALVDGQNTKKLIVLRSTNVATSKYSENF